MHQNKPIFVALALLICLSLACSFSSGSPSRNEAGHQTETQDALAAIAGTQAFEEAQQALTENAVKAATTEAKAAATQTAEHEAEMTQQAEETRAAKTEIAELTMEAEIAATEAVYVAETEQANNFYVTVQDLYDRHVITSTEGEYYRMEDFEESWAQLQWYQWYWTGLEPENFIISAHTEWESASRTANLADSGCGFVYSEDGVEYHYASFLGLDGIVHTYRFKNNIFTEMKGGYFGTVGYPEGEADLMLVVDNHVMTFFVDGTKVVSWEDQSIKKGNLAYTLVSGTNAGFGTRCKMTEIEVWVMP